MNQEITTPPVAPVQEPLEYWNAVEGWVKIDEPEEPEGHIAGGVHPPQRTWVGLDWLPKHRCGLHLSHNEHRDVYETIEEFYDPEDFISTEEWGKAVAEDSVWVLHWYPNTPIGFIRIAASTLEAIKSKLKEKNHD